MNASLVAYPSLIPEIGAEHITSLECCSSQRWFQSLSTTMCRPCTRSVNDAASVTSSFCANAQKHVLFVFGRGENAASQFGRHIHILQNARYIHGCRSKGIHNMPPRTAYPPPSLTPRSHTQKHTVVDGAKSSGFWATHTIRVQQTPMKLSPPMPTTTSVSELHTLLPDPYNTRLKGVEEHLCPGLRLNCSFTSLLRSGFACFFSSPPIPPHPPSGLHLHVHC